MAIPWKVVDSIDTPEGLLELRQRGERDFLITIGPCVLMNSSAHRSEVALGRLACSHLLHRDTPRILVGGLGMGYTLRAVLDTLPETGRVVVAELNPVVPAWCRGPLAELTGHAVDDPRVTIEILNVASLVRKSSRAQGAEGFDAVVFDLYTGPDAGSHKRNDPLYGSIAIDNVRAALKPEGVFAVWGENYDDGFFQRLQSAGFTVTTERPGRGGLRHVVYVARMPHSGTGNKHSREMIHAT